mgnify:CR=1 FL=1
MVSPIKRVLIKTMKAWNPPPRLTVSEWADRYRKLSPESSAEAGQWKTDRAPYQKGIMDACNDRDIETIVVMSSAQIGKTEILNNIVGYYITQDPSPILMLQPTLEMAQTWSKDRLAPMLRDTPALKSKVKDPRSRDSGNTMLHKTFAGGHITMSGANSPASLASRPIRIVLGDEVDRYPVSAGSEGDPVSLARKRTSTFWNRKIILTSTPTIKGISRIEMAYEDSDKRRYHVPCPHCDERQHLKWSQVSWKEDDPESAIYACEHCGGVIEERHKTKMLLQGKWIAENKTKKTAGFHLNELYSPWRTWAEVVEDFLFAKKSPETLKTWVNTSLGETWEDQGETVDDGDLMVRAENYGIDSIPAEVRMLTAGVDVQQDRLEIQIVGWGVDNHSWVIDHKILWGDPAMGEVWNDLDLVLTDTFDGLRIAGCCVDSGFMTDQVYKFTKPRQSRRVFSIKGVAGSGKAVASKPTQAGRNRTMLYTLGVDTIKDAVYSRLKITSGSGQVHFSTDLEPEFYAQLTAEKVVVKYFKGFPRREWIKTRDRNEALDCFAYAFASYHILNPAIEKIKARVEEQDAPIKPKEEKIVEPPISRQKPMVRKPRRGGGFAQRW